MRRNRGKVRDVLGILATVLFFEFAVRFLDQILEIVDWRRDHDLVFGMSTNSESEECY